MAGWFRDAELAPDEQLVFRRAAVLKRGWRSIGGEVCVTDQRLLFVPNRLEAAIRAPSVDVVRAAVHAATVVRPAGRRSALGSMLSGRSGQAQVVTADASYLWALAEPEALVRLFTPLS